MFECVSEEPGLLVIGITRDFQYDGYVGNRAMTEKKILRDVFKTGDRYFNSGDLLVTDRDYFLYFHDRIGDTFRYGDVLPLPDRQDVRSDVIIKGFFKITHGIECLDSDKYVQKNNR